MKTNVKNVNALSEMNVKLTDLNEQELRDINGGTGITVTYVLKDGKVYQVISTTGNSTNTSTASK